MEGHDQKIYLRGLETYFEIRSGATVEGYWLLGHTRATHAHLLGDDDEAVCATCYTSLTVNHILIECPQFNHLRQKISLW